MARFIVERTFPDGLHVPMTPEGAAECLGIVDRIAEVGVTWITSYVTCDRKKTFCVYDGPDEESIHRAAHRSELPIDKVTRVSVLDPYFYS
jgi:hypothetical protein